MHGKISLVLKTFVCLALALLIAAPGLAQENHTNQDAIAPGHDFWQTLGSGATHYDFAGDPLPADFFCKGSKPFSGSVAFEGVPLATEPERTLGSTDTIVERLDTAKFDSKGLASTKIRVRALNLASRDKIENSCGSFTVQASLVGEQPTTAMHFQRSAQCANVGVFTADLALNVQLVFTDTATGKAVTTTRQVNLPTFSDEPYSAGRSARACPVSTLTSNDAVRVFNGSDTAFDIIGNEDMLATGCYCNCAGTQCLPVVPEHEGPDEDHFTVPPCEFFGHPYCLEPNVFDHIRTNVELLRNSGIIDESVTLATDKLVNKSKY